MWNKKNDQYALSCGLRQSTEKLLRWLLRRTKQYEVCEIEIDLKEFNKFIERDRIKGGYDRKTLKQALTQLDEKTQGWILISKSYSWSVHKVIIRPLDFLLREKSPNRDRSPNLKTGESMFGDDHKKRVREQQQQDISRLDQLLRAIGLNYTPDGLNRLWRFSGKSLESVKNAVEYMIHSHSAKIKRDQLLDDQDKTYGIPKPKGWLHDCLKFGWHKHLDDQIKFLLEPNEGLNFDVLIGSG